jgi:hypothetical protein
VLAALCRLQTALLTLEKVVASRHVHRIHLKMRQAGMAACEAAALQFHFDLNPAVPVVGQSAEASLSWHVADPKNAPAISAAMKGPEQITFGPFVGSGSGERRQSMTASLNISGPPIDAMTGWHGLMVDPVSLHAEVSVKIAKTEFVVPLCPDTVFTTMPVYTGQITPNRILLRLGQDSDIDFCNCSWMPPLNCMNMPI